MIATYNSPPSTKTNKMVAREWGIAFQINQLAVITISRNLNMPCIRLPLLISKFYTPDPLSLKP